MVAPSGWARGGDRGCGVCATRRRCGFGGIRRRERGADVVEQSRSGGPADVRGAGGGFDEVRAREKGKQRIV